MKTKVLFICCGLILLMTTALLHDDPVSAAGQDPDWLVTGECNGNLIGRASVVESRDIGDAIRNFQNTCDGVFRPILEKIH